MKKLVAIMCVAIFVFGFSFMTYSLANKSSGSDDADSESTVSTVSDASASSLFEVSDPVDEEELLYPYQPVFENGFPHADNASAKLSPSEAMASIISQNSALISTDPVVYERAPRRNSFPSHVIPLYQPAQIDTCLDSYHNSQEEGYRAIWNLIYGTNADKSEVIGFYEQLLMNENSYSREDHDYGSEISAMIDGGFTVNVNVDNPAPSTALTTSTAVYITVG